MEIVDIFAGKLLSFVYNKSDNEYDRLIDLWTDVNYLRNYAKDNNITDINEFVNNRLRDAENIQDLLDDLTESDDPLEHYFKPFNNNETGYEILAKQKGKKSSRDGLRLYAIRIDKDLFIITGGAIKMSQEMDGHPDTKNEKIKINKAQDFLKENGVFDKDSFYEFKNEIE